MLWWLYVPVCGPSGPYGGAVLVHMLQWAHTHAHTRMHTSYVDARSDNKDCCHLQIRSSDSLLKKKSPAVTFIGGPPEPKRSSLQTKGQVCGGADISTSPSLTHSLQRQKDCIWLNRGWAAPSTVAAAV